MYLEPPHLKPLHLKPLHLKPLHLKPETPSAAPAAADIPATDSVYHFESIQLEPARRRVLRDGKTIALTARAFDLLWLLIRNRHRALTRAELLRRLWRDVCVEDGNLSVHICQLRSALGSSRYILTLPRHGYSFSPDIHVLERALDTQGARAG
jgi:DNA-binding winged helix-turn-helix (wHTH) protein